MSPPRTLHTPSMKPIDSTDTRAEGPGPEPDIEWPGLAADIDGRRDIAKAILADQSGADHGEAAAPADVATTARSSRAHGHATALRASQRHSQALSHTSAIVEPSQLSPAVTL